MPEQLIKRKVTVPYGSHGLTTYVIANKTTHTIMPAACAYLFSLTRDSGLRLNSVKSYASTLVSFLNTIDDDPNIEGFETLTDKQMRAYLELILCDHKKVKENTINQYITRLKGFYDFCWDYGWVLDKPVFSWQMSHQVMQKMKLVEAQKNSLDPYNLPEQYIPESEFIELLSYNPRKGYYENERDEIVFKLGYYSGLRASETVSASNLLIKKIKKSIDKAKGQNQKGFHITIIGKGSNGGKAREIYVPESLKNQILRFIDGTRKNVPGDLLICKADGEALHERLASDTFSDAIKLIAASDAKSSEAWRQKKQRSYHSLRHSYATNLAQWLKENGQPRRLLNERLGHTNDATTLIYVHFNALIHGDVDEQNETEQEIRKANRRANVDHE